MHHPSQRRILAQGLVAEVEHCEDCELMYLHIGAFTLRLKSAVLNDLRDTLNRAITMMPARGHDSATHHAAGTQTSGASRH